MIQAIASIARQFGFAWFALAAFVPGIGTQEQLGSSIPAPALQKVGIDQRLNEAIPLDLAFSDETGQTVKLADYFTDKPVILVLAYYRCPMLCTLVLNDLSQTMANLPFTAGKEFRVLTVSFDPHETPQLAAVKRENYLKKYGRPEGAAGWHFLTGNADSIERLTRAVGFRYYYDDQQKQYVHPSGITILTPSGKISRYFFGIDYSPRDLRLALTEASEDKIGSPTDQILLYCFHYDPNTGKYTPSVLNFVRAGGVLVLVSVIGLFWLLKRGERRRRAKLAAPETAGTAAGNDPARAAEPSLETHHDQ